MNDIWFYQIEQNRWVFVKETYNAQLYLYVKKPSARASHCGAYVELEDNDTFLPDGKTRLTRKYLYIYGGFSYECRTACFDLWRYEIPYGPYNMYPSKTGEWHNVANHWTMLSEDENYSPGPRVKSSMTAIQPGLDKKRNNTEGDYIYIFGGIKVNDEQAVLDQRLKYNISIQNASSYEYMFDLWRFDLRSDQWENLEVFGVVSIKRQISLWNGTNIFIEVPAQEKLKVDLTNVYVLQEKDAPPGTTVQLPPPRGGHTAQLIGNSPDYMLIFGGTTEEILPGDYQVYKLKKTLNDVWVYDTGKRLWSQLFMNSPEAPSPRDSATMVSLKKDRSVMLFGGHRGQSLYGDIWQYNINSNMWQKLELTNTVSDRKEDNLKNCTTCQYCGGCDWKVFKRFNCITCIGCYQTPTSRTNFTELDCTNCKSCYGNAYQDCHSCKNCTSCYNAIDT